jgi:CRISPR-associated protein Cmr5
MTQKAQPEQQPQKQSAQQTLQQRRAKHAWKHVKEVKKDLQDEYRSLVRGLPQLIQTDGLGQTLAFLRAKAKSDDGKPRGHGVAYKHIADWIKTEFDLRDAELLDWLLKQPTAVYRRTTAEVLAYVNWLKRFAEAEVWKDEGRG